MVKQRICKELITIAITLIPNGTVVREPDSGVLSLPAVALTATKQLLYNSLVLYNIFMIRIRLEIFL